MMASSGQWMLPSGKNHIDPEHDQFIVETSLPTPTTARVYVNIPESMDWFKGLFTGKPHI